MVYFKNISGAEWKWATSRTNCILCEDSKGILAYDHTGRYLAASVLDNWTQSGCSVHVAIDSPMVLRHGFLEEVCHYVFNTCGRIMLLGGTPETNVRARRFNEHIGMKEIYRLKNGCALGVDYIYTQMLKEDCRWIEHGKEISSRAA